MSSAILYHPDQTPQAVAAEMLIQTRRGASSIQVAEVVAQLLGCVPGLVDVLASGPGYVAYSVFDYEGPTNYGAMAAVAEVSGVDFNPEEEDEHLCGPVLLIRQ